MTGLLGKKLSHSFSPVIHRAFGNEDYRLFETDDPVGFLSSEPFSAINVTIPYKEAVIPHLDRLDEIAERTQSVNLIVRENNSLIGYNTDYDGLSQLLKHEGISLDGKKVLILGNGGAAKTAFLLAKDQKAAFVTKMVRRIKENDEVLFSQIDKVKEYDIIINTTSVGMFPNNQETLPFHLKDLPNAEAYIDLIYNPLNTGLMLEAKTLSIKASNGLYMLVAQAKRSHELANKVILPEPLTESIYVDLRRKSINLVLVGLPLSGKTMYMHLLAEKEHKTEADTDQMIEAASLMPITEIFRIHGEPYFRELEASTVENIYRLGNQIISTGGGMIENPNIMEKLKQNGVIIFLDKDPQMIMQNQIHNRPLIQSPEDVLKLYNRRKPLYEKYADITVKMGRPVSVIIAEIEAKLHEYLSH